MSLKSDLLEHGCSVSIYFCGLMQYAMPVRTLTMNSSRQPSIRVLKLNVGLCC